jgi:hypothetical protein
MKKIFSILLLFSISLLTFASPKSQDSDFEKNIVKSEVVMPNYDFTFVEMKLSLLDVYASENLAKDFVAEKICDGFKVVQEKPPVGRKTKA